MLFKETKEGETNWCRACECKECPHVHTCGLNKQFASDTNVGHKEDWEIKFDKKFEKNSRFGLNVRYGQKEAIGEYEQVKDFIRHVLSTQEEKIRKEHFEKLGKFAIERLIPEPWDDMQKGWNNAWGLLLTKGDEEITK